MPGLRAHQLDLPVEVFLETGTMGDADHGRSGKVRAQEIEHAGLALLVERRRRLIHDDDLRRVDQQPHEGEALALPP
jgi:hypothetical protein